MMKEPPVIVEPVQRPVRIEAPLNRRLARMRFLSRFLDNAIQLPGGYRIGFDPIIGLVPGIGDFVASTLSVWLIYDAARLGLKKRILLLMAANVVIETLVGAIPVLGDFIDAAWKANARNMQLVEKHHSAADRERSIGKLAFTFILGLMTLYGLMFGALYLVYRGLVSFFVQLFS